MDTIHIDIKTVSLAADLYTPVSLYLKLRDKFVNTIMLESSDYHGKEHSFTYICCGSVAKFEADGNTLQLELPNGDKSQKELGNKRELPALLKDFMAQFQAPESIDELPFSLPLGLYGYMGFDAVQYFEEIDFNQSKRKYGPQIPEMVYQAYKYILAINHYNDELYIVELDYEGDTRESKLDLIQTAIADRGFATYDFALDGEEQTNVTDEEFLEIIKNGKKHCHRGDVFQIVLSRRFSQKFKGDEFTVYRSLRSINPSPYLFYFDFGSYKIFGSSPEAQLVVRNGQATIHPIAGTYRRTGNDALDKEKATELFNDPKENSEHVMLVDLARNDLSIFGDNVTVEMFKDIQYFSHVIHLVSTVVGDVTDDKMLRLAGGTFPAGTLSGAPKYKAMELIDKYENTGRSYYGGAIGYIGLNNEFNHAIMIRTFLAKENTLYYQAGAGVVDKSVPESELQEVHNKLAALRKALESAAK